VVEAVTSTPVRPSRYPAKRRSTGWSGTSLSEHAARWTRSPDRSLSVALHCLGLNRFRRCRPCVWRRTSLNSTVARVADREGGVYGAWRVVGGGGGGWSRWSCNRSCPTRPTQARKPPRWFPSRPADGHACVRNHRSTRLAVTHKIHASRCLLPRHTSVAVLTSSIANWRSAGGDGGYSASASAAGCRTPPSHLLAIRSLPASQATRSAYLYSYETGRAFRRAKRLRAEERRHLCRAGAGTCPPGRRRTAALLGNVNSVTLPPAVGTAVWAK